LEIAKTKAIIRRQNLERIALLLLCRRLETKDERKRIYYFLYQRAQSMIYWYGVVNDILVEDRRVFHFIHALSYRKRGIEKGTSTTYRPAIRKK
jgi:hypothetical protein